MHGVLVVDKPRGPTSHDIVARARRGLGVSRIGHAGTLDPMATGVVVLAIGEATKLVPWLSAHDKAYEATVRLGIETDTLDANGPERSRVPLGDALRKELSRDPSGPPGPLLLEALDREALRTLQVPPLHSAIKVGGERSFALARRGVAPNLAPRAVRVLAIRPVAWRLDPPELDVSIETSKGYYVRALARDLAASLGTVGHLTRLRRVRSGCFGIEEAASLDVPWPELARRIEPVARAAGRALPIVRLTEAGARDARRGFPVDTDAIEAPESGPCAWIDPAGAIVAVGERRADGRLTVIRGFTSSCHPYPSPTSPERP